ncbi:ferric reductase-like transmembrane domain-containing protein [Clostridium sardiniense]|uniref:ferric reductase-like transmembrane domain-containing protein n=1 Tax=Clostridium sardiniense TaxID=29369 RepID=UPI003D3389E8
MYLIYSLIVVILMSLLFTKTIRNHSKIFYSIASIAAITTTIYEILRLTSNLKLQGIIANLEKASMKGNIAIAFFVLVMFAGALNSRWAITKKLLSIRAELAILGSILILPHCVMYFVRFIVKLFNNQPIKPLYLIYLIVGLIAFIIMIPLFITSLKKFRSKMKYKDWKKLQRYAYPFYLLAYVHILLALLNSKQVDLLKLITYTVLFGVYFILKLVKTFSKKI